MKLATICTGGGVYEQGAIAAGLEPIWGVEINPRVAEVYKLNYPNSQMVVGDACQVDWNTLPCPDVLHASPSCRHFSTANNKSEATKDIAVAMAVGRAIAHFHPQIFTLENVAAYQNSESWTVILDALQSLGYSVSYQVHKLKYWGIPQKQRNRFIAIGTLSSREEVVGSRYGEHSYLLPTTHYLLPKNPLLLTPNRTRHWYEEIRDLIPTFEPSSLTNTQKDKMNLKTRKAIASGETVLLKRNQIRDYTPAAYKSDPYCWSITATLATDQNQSNRSKFADLVTPDGIFSLNTRALARIQTIPDSYRLSGNVAIDGLVIGDGVPPYFVEQMWEQILSQELKVTSNECVDAAVTAQVPTLINQRRAQLVAGDKSEGNSLLVTRYSLLKKVRSTNENIGAITPLAVHDQNDLTLRSASSSDSTFVENDEQELIKLENIIEQESSGLSSFDKVGNALLKIQSEKLFVKKGYASFVVYCRDRFEISTARIYQLINGAKTFDTVSTFVESQDLQITEAHCRSLAKIKDVEMRSLVLEKVAKKGTITAKAIDSEYREMKVRAIAIKNNPELPRIGEVVRLTTKFKHDCLSYNGYWGIVCGVGEYSISVSVLDQILYNLHPQDFIFIGSVEGTSALLSRLNKISKSPDIDITVRELLKAIATNSYPELTKWQEKYLDFTEKELLAAEKAEVVSQLDQAWEKESSR